MRCKSLVSSFTKMLSCTNLQNNIVTSKTDVNASVTQSFNRPIVIIYKSLLLAVVLFVEFCDWVEKKPMLPCLANKNKHVVFLANQVPNQT